MRGELPVFKRCCFCLPLRYGLITWGYLKLIAACLLIIELSFALHKTKMSSLDEKNKTSEFVVISIALFVYITDFVLATVFIVGGHMKNVKLLRVVYFYSIIMWVLMILVFGVTVGLSISSRLEYKLTPLSLEFILLELSVFFTNIVIHTYFLLLLRSEIIKLKNNCEFRFVNTATEAECTMKCDEDHMKI